jgi:hypothetical protein
LSELVIDGKGAPMIAGAKVASSAEQPGLIQNVKAQVNEDVP